MARERRTHGRISEEIQLWHVVRELIPYELGGTVEYQLSPEGAQCQMDIPLDRLSGGSPQNNQDPFLATNDIGKTRAN
jgi:hypothetical protein